LSIASILLIDPDHRFCERLQKDLNLHDYETRSAADAKAALGLLLEKTPDLVIMDETVNGLSPDHLMNIFNERGMDTFILATSAQPDLDRAMDMIMSGVFAYLQKPLAISRLREVIARGLSNKEAYHEVVAMTEELARANQALEREKAALKEKTEALGFLYDLESRLSTTLKEAEAASLAAQAVRELANADLVIVLTDFSDDQGTRFFSDRRLSPDLAGSLSIDLCIRLGQDILKARNCRISEQEGVNRPLTVRPNHEITLPLVAGTSFGFIGAYFNKEPLLTEDCRMLLKSVSLNTAQALSNAHQHELALSLAAHDALTGLYNRRTFDGCLRREFENYRRYANPAALIIIDLDHFKNVNDALGHEAGDEVLRTVARILGQSVRTTDITARIGGEEFAVILPNSRQIEALPVAQRIQDNLRRNRFKFGDKNFKQTVSQGLADTVICQPDSPEALLRQADLAMYQAKKEGRNTIRMITDLTYVTHGKDNVHVWSR
jgi:diguanylate cyclase (GGDEF)-like protein